MLYNKTMNTYNSNEIKVLNLIYKNKYISRAEIARQLNLERSTVSYIIKKLESNNIVIFGDKISTKGRTSLNLEINPNYCTNLIINLKQNSIIFDLTTFTGQKINQVNTLILENDSHLTEIKKMILIFTQTHPNLKNILIAYHGMVNNNKKESFSPFYDLLIEDIYRSLQDTFKLTFYIKNESNLIALGLQDNYQCDNLLAINIDQGIGCGIVVNSKLLTGNDGYAGEFGHQIVDKNGPRCTCGNHGCIEMICSERALQDATKAQIKLAIEYLSIGLNNYLLAFNPQKVIIRSKLFYAQENFEILIAKNLNSKNIKMPEIISTFRRDSDILLGATKFIFNETITKYDK